MQLCYTLGYSTYTTAVSTKNFTERLTAVVLYMIHRRLDCYNLSSGHIAYEHSMKAWTKQLCAMKRNDAMGTTHTMQ